MSENILVCVAWPYANGPIHHGQLGGAYLPADIFARYHRIRGNRVAMVSGSDAHGTPITVRADDEGKTPREVVDYFHPEILRTWEGMGISFDTFTTTMTDNHREVVHGLFNALQERGHLFTRTQDLFYDPEAGRFLPDRYVTGECPRCGDPEARGDQCDACGSQLDAIELINPQSRQTGATPDLRQSEHYFLRLSGFQEQLQEWLAEGKEHWRAHVLNFTRGMLREGLPDRAITRDIAWGVPVPIEGWEEKRIYVWFEAVIGYLSATIEWARTSGEPEAWRDFWQSDDARIYNFIGKDNVPFHTVIWPAILLGAGGYRLPYDVPANQYITMSGSKASTSKRWAVWINDYLERYDPDPLRYALAAQMPETGDSDFSWREFWRRNNDELVATWGNLVNRVFSLINRHFDGRVPEPGPLDRDATLLLDRAQATLNSVAASIEAVHLRQGLQQAFALAQETNRYIDQQAPWKALPDADRTAGARALYTSLNVIAALRTILAPYLPFSCQQLHEMLGGEGEIRSLGWQMHALRPGAPVAEAKPLFKKLDESIIDEEEDRLGT